MLAFGCLPCSTAILRFKDEGIGKVIGSVVDRHSDGPYNSRGTLRPSGMRA